MPLELSFEVSLTHARVRVQGKGSMSEFLAVLGTLAAMAAHTHPLLLLDLCQMHGLEKPTEQLTAGMEAARHLSHARRVAVVEPASRVTFNGEKAARRLGLDLRVFAAEDEPQAIAWLTEEASAA